MDRDRGEGKKLVFDTVHLMIRYIYVNIYI